MIPIGLIIFLLLLFASVGAGIAVLLNRKNRVTVWGRNFATGLVEDQTLKPLADGTVRWRYPGGGFCRIPLDKSAAWGGGSRPIYDADVTPGQGRLMYINKFHNHSESFRKLATSLAKNEQLGRLIIWQPADAKEVLRTPGDRLDRLLASSKLGEANGRVSPMGKGWLLGAIIGGSIFGVAVIGMLAYIVNVLNGG